MKRLIKKLSVVSLGLLLSANILVATPAFALLEGSKEAVCKGIALNETANCDAAGTQADKANGLVGTALNIFSLIIGIIAIIMVMVGGIKYITSQGDSAQTNNAKNTVLYAAIGLAIAALAQIIVKFVLSRFG